MLHNSLIWMNVLSTEKQGISKRFLNYFQSLDKSVGARALGPEQTISGKLQSAVASASQQARAVDEQKGYCKTAQDVSFFLLRWEPLLMQFDKVLWQGRGLSFWTESLELLHHHDEASHGHSRGGTSHRCRGEGKSCIQFFATYLSNP